MGYDWGGGPDTHDLHEIGELGERHVVVGGGELLVFGVVGCELVECEVGGGGEPEEERREEG